MSLPGSCTHLAPPTLHHNLGHVDDVSHRFYVLSFPALNGFRKDLQLKLFPLPQFLTLRLEITTVCFVSKSADANADHPKEDGFTSQACMWAQCSKDCTTCKTWLQCSRFHRFTPKETQNDETNLAKVDTIGQSYTYACHLVKASLLFNQKSLLWLYYTNLVKNHTTAIYDVMNMLKCQRNCKLYRANLSFQTSSTSETTGSHFPNQDSHRVKCCSFCWCSERFIQLCWNSKKTYPCSTAKPPQLR